MKLIASLALLIAALDQPVMARDGGDWDAVPNSLDVRKWFRELMQPDNPNVSCCGEADAYYADSFEIDGDKYVAIITDTRDDKPLGRPHIAPGTRVVVPNHKLKFDRGNPTAAIRPATASSS